MLSQVANATLSKNLAYIVMLSCECQRASWNISEIKYIFLDSFAYFFLGLIVFRFFGTLTLFEA